MEEEVAIKKRKIRELKERIKQQQQIPILSPLATLTTDSFSTKISTRTKKPIIPEKPFSKLSLWSKVTNIIKKYHF